MKLVQELETICFLSARCQASLKMKGSSGLQTTSCFFAFQIKHCTCTSQKGGEENKGVWHENELLITVTALQVVTYCSGRNDIVSIYCQLIIKHLIPGSTQLIFFP